MCGCFFFESWLVAFSCTMAKMFGSKITRRRTPWLSPIVCSFFLCNCLSFNDKYHHLYLFSNEPYATHTTTERPASQKSLFCSSLYVRAHFCYVLFVLLSFPVCVCVNVVIMPFPPGNIHDTHAHQRTSTFERTNDEEQGNFVELVVIVLHAHKDKYLWYAKRYKAFSSFHF